MPTKIRPDPHLSFITDGLSGRFICTPGGIRFRSLNRRTDTLEWCLCSFRANELSSFVFGTPHWGGICIVRPRPTAVCPNPQNIANRKTLPKGEGCSVGTPGGIRTHGLPLRRSHYTLFCVFLHLPGCVFFQRWRTIQLESVFLCSPSFFPIFLIQN